REKQGTGHDYLSGPGGRAGPGGVPPNSLPAVRDGWSDPGRRSGSPRCGSRVRDSDGLPPASPDTQDEEVPEGILLGSAASLGPRTAWAPSGRGSCPLAQPARGKGES